MKELCAPERFVLVRTADKGESTSSFKWRHRSSRLDRLDNGDNSTKFYKVAFRGVDLSQ
jgi:hypothetical protein